MSNLTVTSKQTPYTTGSTIKSSGISSSTTNNRVSSCTVKTKSTTVTKTSGTMTSSTTASYGASSTQSAVKITSSSTTAKISSATPSGTISGNSGSISSETVKSIFEVQNDGSINGLIDKINKIIYPQVENKMKEIVDKNISLTKSYRVFDVAVDTPMASFEYYADIKTTNNKDGVIDFEFSKELKEMMNGFGDLGEIAFSAGSSGAGININEGQMWIKYSKDGKSLSLNLSKMMQGRLSMTYEETKDISGYDGKTQLTVGMKIDAQLDERTANKFVEEYETAYDTYLDKYHSREAVPERGTETQPAEDKPWYKVAADAVSDTAQAFGEYVYDHRREIISALIAGAASAIAGPAVGFFVIP